MLVYFTRFPLLSLSYGSLRGFSSSVPAFACLLFDGIPQKGASPSFAFFPERNSGFYNQSLVSSSTKHGHDQEAGYSVVRELASLGRVHESLRLFCRLNSFGLKSTKFTLCSVLSSCAKSLDWLLGLQVHARIIQIGFEDNLFLNSALVDLYAKCGTIVDARKIFDGMKSKDQVAWTSILSGLSQNGDGREALVLFKDMFWTDVRPNCFTFASIISACTGLEKDLLLLMLFHAHVIKFGVEGNSFVTSSLIDCYSKCGRITQAVSLFSATRERDIIILNSMITGYSDNLLGEEALRLFVEMLNDGFKATNYTFVSVLNACGSLTVLQQGRQMHSLVMKIGSDQNVFVSGSLIDMYAKCGSINDARCIFDETIDRNNILWTSMITGYAQSGRGADALELFECLLMEKGVKLDQICFTAVLTACNHAGFLDRGIKYFNKMREYGLVPELDQYACMVDLYGRNGLLREAKELIREMPFEPNAVIWSSLLGSCRLYGDVHLGREAANQLLKMDPYDAASYVALGNIYAEAGMWGEASEVRKMMIRKGVRKNAGWSWVEVDKRVHVLRVGDTSHPQSQEIYMELDKLTLEMKDAGYMPIF
ncbi:pentatricopeptide repeat-containing protein At3g02330, mitochondrial-like isoform X1 [Macadamia integrifolia]|uniref:pentatricopeptide repeat-containing protein At3g02330, mitochondrial-like isoform X1 n=1 Tax=Macadamia integrifolia TaxID=60698 RepID=UPI001C52E61D|nr:pentatricopeptide repeat-containing protein At3g02330, mitochondrial-like isoform X1 [Macadamia integrifolia]XP_042479251.1 pentatricopeptide repeat-containing protein At3g02330, mitochondrial-like isoform X1 [Macadamia integrifolia]XP_042479253.1 pentatricopeptide repeat-containing protein At3g02330, mitochondrial-like isoform X1 [Macadamia integrifolia]